MDTCLPDSQSSRSCDDATLKAEIREYVTLLGLVKDKREELKKFNASLAVLRDDIMKIMIQRGLPECHAGGYKFVVKEKTKMKSATAKSFLMHVKDFFKIPDNHMASFMDKMEARRQREAQVISTLDCKPIKSPKENENGNGNGEDEVVPALSQSIDDLFSRPEENF